jgi:hypothetical protein
VDRVAHALRVQEAGRDPYTLIHILGRSGACRYRALVEQFLEFSTDPMVARIALQVLCSHWNLVADYEEAILRFARGVEWDIDEEVRQAAISAAGELLRNAPAEELKHLLAAIFMNHQESQPSRQAAYFALARAHGRSWADLPPADRTLDLDLQTDPEVIRWATADR